ncbi:peptidase dimerization domain-containing protein [Embleya sp. NPDC005971]|uniref:peptidase dimerization domain-containing protein n=1 Tax=Embleya sp. NPDC005971 TaxID=3156724 RepID=UPI00341085C7
MSAPARTGAITSCPGPVTVAGTGFRIPVHGRSGHGSALHRAADPVPAAAEIVTALQVLVTRTTDAFEPVTLSVGVLRAGTIAPSSTATSVNAPGANAGSTRPSRAAALSASRSVTCGATVPSTTSARACTRRSRTRPSGRPVCGSPS